MAHISPKVFRGMYVSAASKLLAFLGLIFLPMGPSHAQNLAVYVAGFGTPGENFQNSESFLSTMSPGLVLVITILGLLTAILVYTALSARSLKNVLITSGLAEKSSKSPQNLGKAKASRGHFEDFIDHGPNPVAVLDPSLVFTSVNLRWLEALQTDQRHIVGRRIGEVLPWILTANFLDACRTVLRTKRSANLGRAEIAMAYTSLPFNMTATAVGRQLADVLPPYLLVLAMGEGDKALTTGETQYVQHSADLPIGTRNYEARIVASGEDESVAIIRNITSQKREEKTLVESQNRLCAMVRFPPLDCFNAIPRAKQFI